MKNSGSSPLLYSDMQKYPSSLAVLAETFLPSAETFQKIPLILENISGNQEEIESELNNSSLWPSSIDVLYHVD